MSADNPTICFCLNVKKNDIIDSINNGAKTVNDVRKATRACCGCQSCYADIEVLLDKYAPEQESPQQETSNDDNA